MATKTIAWDKGDGNITITYDGSGNGTIVVTSSDNNLFEERSKVITVSTTAGSPQQTKTITIVQEARAAIDISSAVITAANQTYSGSALTPTPAVTLNGETVPSAGYDVTYSNNTNAGTATITVTGKGDYTGTATGTFTINKAAPTYTAPTARSLTYSGSSQYLTTTGSTSHGTIYYSSDGTNWYTTRRTGTNAGDYTTYWKLTGDSNHSDIASTSISTTIAQATGQITTAPTANTMTYSGSAQYLVTAGSGTGTIYYSYRYKSYSASSWGSWSTASTTRPSRTNAGYYEVRYYAAASSDGNYSQSATGTVSSIEIQKATPTYTAPTKKTGLTYTGSAQALLNAGSTSHGTFYYSINNGTWSTSIPTQTNANTSGYTVYWKLTGDSNHTDVASTTISGITIAKASRTISFSDAYNVVAPSGSITKTATPSAGSGDGAVTYSISSTTYATINSSTGKVTAKTSEGSATVIATVAEGTNYLSVSATYTLYVFSTTHNFDYTGSVQSLLLPPGSYKLECWGAQGGSNAAASSYSITAQSGGKGGYSTGQLTLASAQTVYAFVGGQGGASGNGGWNGGGGGSGSSSYNSSNTNGVSRMGCGGGATDIALTTSTMTYSSYRTNRSSASYLSRMIVAGGGSGGAMCYKAVTTSSTQTITDYACSSIIRTIISGSNAIFVLVEAGTTTTNKSYSVAGISSEYGYSWKWSTSPDAENAPQGGYVDYNNQSPVTAPSGYPYFHFYIYRSLSYFPIEHSCTSVLRKITSGSTSIFIMVEAGTYTPGATYTVTGIPSGYAYDWKFSTSASATAAPQGEYVIYTSRPTIIAPSGYTYLHFYIYGSNVSDPSGFTINFYRVEQPSGIAVNITHTETSSTTTKETSSQAGYTGGGTSGGGYSDTYKGRQSASGTNGGFGYGGNQTATDYRYAPACGGGGWYGGGSGSASDSSMTNCKYSGGGSGFVNTSANASYRPSGYTGLQLDSGSTYDGAQTFKAPSGSNETGHSGNGYARVTRL